MKTAVKNKRKSLFLPLFLLFLILFFAVVVFGTVRYFVAVRGWEFERSEFFRVLWETLPALIAIAVAALFSLVYLAVGFARPVSALRVSAGRIAERISTGEGKPTKAGAGCVGALSDALVNEEAKLAELVATTAKDADARADEREKRSAALQICEAVVPERLEFGALTYGVLARTLRSPAVGADFCDGFARDDRRVFIAVGDVWERGLPAALFTAKLVRGLREKIAEGKSPAEALSALNASALADGNAATLFCGIFDGTTGELRYANAGHLPPVVAGETSGFLRMRAGTPLGLYADAVYTDETFTLSPGQGLVVYTDGVVNAFNGKEYFGYDKLLGLVGKHYGDALAANSVADGIADALQAFGGEREDDCAVLSLFYPAGVQRLLVPELSELGKMRELLDHWLGEDPRKKNIQLACEEIFTNIVGHAGAKSIQINCERDENSIIIRFTDDGEPFNPLQAESGEKDFYAYAEGGMGMTIIRRIAGEIFYRTKQNLNVLTVRFPVIKGI